MKIKIIITKRLSKNRMRQAKGQPQYVSVSLHFSHCPFFSSVFDQKTASRFPSSPLDSRIFSMQVTYAMKSIRRDTNIGWAPSAFSLCVLAAWSWAARPWVRWGSPSRLVHRGWSSRQMPRRSPPARIGPRWRPLLIGPLERAAGAARIGTVRMLEKKMKSMLVRLANQLQHSWILLSFSSFFFFVFAYMRLRLDWQSGSWFCTPCCDTVRCPKSSCP